MNRLLPYLVIALLSVVGIKANAQISLGASDIGSIGDSVVLTTDTTYNGLPGDTGLAQIWPFANLVNVSQRATRFINPINSAYGNPFGAGSNFATDIDSNYTFYKQNLTGIKQGLFLHGLVLKFPLPGNPNGILKFGLSNDLTFLKYPSAYGENTSETGTSQFAFRYDTTVLYNNLNLTVDSIRIKATVNVKSRCNGSGDLFLQNSTFPALRQAYDTKITFVIQVRVNIPFFGKQYVAAPGTAVPPIETKLVRYWANGKKWPVLTFALDSAGNNVRSSTYQTATSVGLDALAFDTQKASVSPNPVGLASSNINLNLPITWAAINYSVIASNGTVCTNGLVKLDNNAATNAIPLPLVPGIYLLKLKYTTISGAVGYQDIKVAR